MRLRCTWALHSGRVTMAVLLAALVALSARTSVFSEGASVQAVGSWPKQLEADLVRIAQNESAKYNCSVSITLVSEDGELNVAHGTIDFSSQKPAQVSDAYAWGSVTKMFTAASIMKLVSNRAFKLDDPVGPLVDPLLAKMARASKQNFSSVEDLWGNFPIRTTTIRQLLSMKAGLPDFDTAMPTGGVFQDSLREELYKNPSKVYSPTDLMSEPWVANKWKHGCTLTLPPPLGHFCYSSTNFMLLGLVLANNASATSWDTFDQSSYLPASLVNKIKFANTGAPKAYSPVHGYDRTAYNMPRGQTNDHDNWAVDGVFAGWTASNLVGNASAVANLAWEIYGPPSSIAPKEFMQQMVPKSLTEFYGLGTFNLEMFTGQRGTYGAGYGHLGATYGFQSIAGYFPGANFALSVATNIETNNQAQPTDAMCFAYNAALGAKLQKTITCEFESRGYFGGICKCNPVDHDAEMILI